MQERFDAKGIDVRLLRVGEAGAERPALLASDTDYVEIGDLVGDIDGPFLSGDGLARLHAATPELLATARRRPLAGSRIGAPITRPHQILCIGLNYRDHAHETGQAVPGEPIVFTKSPNTLVGPNDDVQIPRRSQKTDYEVELGIVIGRYTHYLARPADAAAHIAGFVMVNDVSERAFQLEHGGQWSKGKSCATFNPCGPYLVTTDEIADVQSLDLTLSVNGERRQSGNTRTMIFGVDYLVWYLSQYMALEPGDLINTGTPPGVGMAFKPPRFLDVGDIVELEIDRLGTQRQRLVAAP